MWPLGCASCRRISSASIPPTRKKPKAVTPYRMPIRLWSTVVNHDAKPVMARGRRRMAGCSSIRSTSAGVVTVGSRTVAISRLPECGWRSLQRIQVGDQLSDLVLAEIEVRHHRSRLHGGRVEEPPAQVGVVD